MVFVVAVRMVDFDCIIHREDEPAMYTPSALTFEEFSTGCVSPKGLSSSCTPVAPVPIIWTHPCAQRRVSFDRGFLMPEQGGSFPHDTVMLTFSGGFDVFFPSPLCPLLGVSPFCPVVYLVPQQVLSPLKGFGASLCFVVVAPSHNVLVACAYDLV